MMSMVLMMSLVISTPGTRDYGTPIRTGTCCGAPSGHGIIEAMNCLCIPSLLCPPPSVSLCRCPMCSSCAPYAWLWSAGHTKTGHSTPMLQPKPSLRCHTGSLHPRCLDPSMCPLVPPNVPLQSDGCSVSGVPDGCRCRFQMMWLHCGML